MVMLRLKWIVFNYDTEVEEFGHGISMVMSSRYFKARRPTQLSDLNSCLIIVQTKETQHGRMQLLHLNNKGIFCAPERNGLRAPLRTCELGRIAELKLSWFSQQPMIPVKAITSNCSF